LITVDMMPAGSNDSAHVDGWLSHGGEVIEVLRLSALTPGPSETLLAAPLQDFARVSGFLPANPDLKDVRS
jgi:hypothetical protein